MRERLYHTDYLEGKVCLTQEELDKCKAEGAADAPWKVTGIIPKDLEGKVSLPSKDNIIAKDVPNEPKPPEKNEKYCECGCGQVVTKRFAPGHWKKMMDKKRMEKSSPNV